MANRAYLCCSNLDRTYPSFRNRSYREEVHTLAAARDRVPLLWLALFAPNDLRTDELVASDGRVASSLAPLARKVDALARLDGAVGRLEEAFPHLGPLAAHAEPFRRMLESARGKLVTIELDEIGALSSSRRAFDERLRKALRYLTGSRVSGIGKVLAEISGLDPARRLVPPRELFSRSRPTKADLLACSSVVGTSHIRKVPWEDAPAPPSPARRRAPALEHQLHDALSAGDETLARELLARGANPNSISARHSCLAMQYVIWGKVHPDMGRALVAAGFDLAKRYQGYTAMHSAIGHDQVDHVRAQLDLGASPTHEDSFHRSPLALAACRGALGCLELFLGLGAESDAIQKAIRHAEKTLAKPHAPALKPELVQAIGAAILRLRAALPAGDAISARASTLTRATRR